MKENVNALGGEGWPVSFFGHLTPVQSGYGIHWIGNLVSTEASLYIVQEWKITAVPGISPQFFNIMARYWTE
jgi:hypothetical protein